MCGMLYIPNKLVTLSVILVILVAVSQGLATFPCSDMVCWLALPPQAIRTLMDCHNGLPPQAIRTILDGHHRLSIVN